MDSVQECNFLMLSSLLLLLLLQRRRRRRRRQCNRFDSDDETDSDLIDGETDSDSDSDGETDSDSDDYFDLDADSYDDNSNIEEESEIDIDVSMDEETGDEAIGEEIGSTIQADNTERIITDRIEYQDGLDGLQETNLSIKTEMVEESDIFDTAIKKEVEYEESFIKTEVDDEETCIKTEVEDEETCIKTEVEDEETCIKTEVEDEETCIKTVVENEEICVKMEVENDETFIKTEIENFMESQSNDGDDENLDEDVKPSRKAFKQKLGDSKTSVVSDDSKDEFDLMLDKNKKSLKEKFENSLIKVEGKGKKPVGRGRKKKNDDGLIQSQLNFSKSSTTVRINTKKN